MIYCENSCLEAMALHHVGNRTYDDGVNKSECLLNLDEGLRKVLVQYFIGAFKTEGLYRFDHHSGLDYNFVYRQVSDIFDNPDDLLRHSYQLADQLYETSDHNKIKSGEFYVVYFSELELDGQRADAVGLFKSENKEIFLQVIRQGYANVLRYDEGVDVRKLDKGCIILNVKKDDGYVVAVVDNTNKSDAKYWVEDFLGVMPRQDKYFQTQNFMSVCKSFVTKQLPEEFEISKADQVELLNRSVQYFKENDEFSMQDFSSSVLEQPEVIESFNSYKERYQSEREITLEDSFSISGEAVKKQSRSFKSVIKLDKNFHIYVHGDRRMIEQGEDEKGRYYKVYYNEEY